jgi:uncharacterized protein (DUF2147 family)
MKTFSFLLFMLLFQISPFLSAQNADAIVGEWLPTEGDAKIKIYKKGNKYQGEIYWLKEPISKIDGKPKRDRYNPDSKLQFRPIIGLVILTDLIYDAKANEWTGKVYDPKKGRSADCFIVLKNPKTLILTGYMGLRSLNEKKTWLRVK